MSINSTSTGEDTGPTMCRDNEGRPTLWDPAGAWPAGRKWIWALLAIYVLTAQGPSFLRTIPGSWDGGNDFFQDWTSARNVLEGRPAYLPLSEAAALHGPKVGGRPAVIPSLPWNAHPPTSVLMTLPLALLDYLAASTVWNLLSLIAIAASLALILRELRFPLAAWSILPIATLTLLCNPLRAQVIYGQWNALLLMLLTLGWVADRRDQYQRAGFWVAVAATLKLFPFFFLVYFAIRGRWRAVLACSLWGVVVSLVTVVTLGFDAYRDYYSYVLPTLKQFQAYWSNSSMTAFWLKNFSTGAPLFGLHIEPVVFAPHLALAGIVASYTLILATTCWFIGRSRFACDTRSRCGDLCFALSTVAMLLLTPVCWEHYLLLLALPLALVWAGLGQSNLQRFAFLILIAAVWVGPKELYRMGGVDLLAKWPDYQDVPPATYVIRRPLFPPLVLSVHFYALLASDIWLAVLMRREAAAAKPGTTADPRISR
jgi:hypothetical protein